MNDKLSLDEEKSIIKDCKKNLASFSKLYKAYIDEVYRYVYIILKDKDKTEDIISQTFLIALEKIKEYECKGIPIKFWLFTIARNLISNLWKKQKEVSLDESLKIKSLDQLLVEDIAVQDELKSKLKELIFKLDSTTREVISLRIWEDLRFREISKLLNMKESTVKNRFARGIKKLKKILEQEEKKLAVSLATIIVGIKYLKETVDFLPSKGFKNYLAKQITSKLNLSITKTKMDAVKKQGKEIKQIAKGAKLSKPLVLKIAAATIIVLGGITGGGYLLYKKSQESDSKKQESVEQEDQGEEDEITQEENIIDDDPYKDWKTYENNVFNYSLHYPSDWDLDSSIAEARYTWEESSGNPDAKDANLLIQKGQYIFYLSMPNKGRGANVCKFSDTDSSSSTIPGEMILGDSKNLFNEDYKELKRNKYPDKYEPFLEKPDIYLDYRLKNGDVGGMFYICQEIDKENVYFEVLRFDEMKDNDSHRAATIMYLMPEQPSEEMLDTMDKILESVRLFMESEEDPYEGWKIYENQDKEISLKYPSDWIVEEDLNNPLYYSITATDGKDHSIRFYGHDDTYPYYCIYPDTNQDLIPGDPLGINREFNDYTEVKNETVSYRRAKYVFGNGSFELTVCKKQENGLYKTEYTYIGYEVPNNPDSDKLKILDLILLSYTKTDAYAG